MKRTALGLAAAAVVVASLTACQQGSEPGAPVRESLAATVAASPALTAAHPEPGRPTAAEDRAAINARIDTVLGDHAKYEQAFTALQGAVAAHDANGVAAMVAYPFTATFGGKKVKLPDARSFVAHYDLIVTPTIANAITRQRYADLHVNDQGVMFGDGEAWLNGTCKDTACKDVDVKLSALQSTK